MGTSTYYLNRFSPKLHEINSGQDGGGSLLPSPTLSRSLDPLMTRLLLIPTGVGEGEFSSKEQLQYHIERAFMNVTIHDCDADEKIFGFSMLYPTPLSRSFAPKYAGKSKERKSQT